jgi:PAS domain S-box-containing protein
VSSVVHIVDDDARVRAATNYLLARQGYGTEIYASGDQFLAEAKLGKGCVLLDLAMPGRSGLDVLAELSRRGAPIPVIVATSDGEHSDGIEAMKLGAIDVLHKPYEEGTLIAAVERALEVGSKALTRSGSRAVAAQLLRGLSPRQRQVLQGLLAGMTNKAIARRLGLSPRTIEMHRGNMMHDLGVASLSDAVRIAVDAELTPLDSGDEEEASKPAPPVPAARKAPVPAKPVTSEEGLPAVLDVLEGTTDCVFLIDADWRLFYVNSNAAELVGSDRHLIGRSVWDAFPLAASTKAWQELNRAATDRHPVRFEFFEPDVQLWLDVSALPIPAGLQVCFRDVTGERTLGAALQMSEETLRLTLEAAGDGVWDWDIRTGNVTIAPDFIKRLGYAPELLPGRLETLRHLVHPDDWPTFSGKLKDHFEGRSPFLACEYRARRSDGGWCWCDHRGRIVGRDPLSGAPIRMVGTVTDITERKTEEALAREAIERIELAQSNAGVGIWDLDLERRTLHLCPRSLSMHGLSEDGPSGVTEAEWEATLHPADVAPTHAELKRSIESGTTYRAQYRTIDASGQCRWITGLGKPVVDEAGRTRRFVGLNLDTTDCVTAVETLQRLQWEAVQLSRLDPGRATAAVIARELSQPLEDVVGFAGRVREAVQDGRSGPAAALQAAAQAEESARHAAQIVGRLCARQDGPRQFKEENLREIVEEACRVCADHLSAGAAACIDIESAAEPVVVDRASIEQVCLNLIGNAIEAMAASCADAAVRISARRIADGYAEVRIGGEGVPQEPRSDHLCPCPSSKPQGVGIGLSVCRSIVEAHGGRLWVEDNGTGGGSFCFTLPLAAN